MARSINTVHALIATTLLYQATGCSRDAGYIQNLRRFRENTEARISADALQSWATNLLATYGTDRTDWIPTAKATPLIMAISTQSPAIQVGRDPSGHGTVVLMYGGGFGHWGLLVGEPNLPMPMRSHDLHYEAWRPGVYFWAESK